MSYQNDHRGERESDSQQDSRELQIISHISREFTMSKSDWLQLAINSIAMTQLEDDNISIQKAAMSLTYEMEWQKKKEDKR